MGDKNAENRKMTYIVKTKENIEIARFSDITDAFCYIRALAMEESRIGFLTWLVYEMFERKVTSPSDVPEKIRELKQYEMIDLYEKRFLIEGRRE